MRNIKSEHERYLHQSQWTKDLRAYVLRKIATASNSMVLELGAGTGAIIAQMDKNYSSHALDIDFAALRYSKINSAQSSHTHADGHFLPYASSIFDVSYCHYLLLWVEEPGRILAEMKRVTQNGGWLVAFAEPDYGGRIDYPDKLAELGKLQASSLEKQGAEVLMGRKLGHLFSQIGLSNIKTGVMGMQKSLQPLDIEKKEQNTLAKDIEGMITPGRLKSLLEIEILALEQGTRVNYVPTFYAFGMKA